MVPDLSAQDIRRVEFRERLRGYHQGDVDEFLERVAAAVDQLEARLARASSDRATPAGAQAARATSSPATEQSLQRTLELAQRAADLAVQEAREQGAAIVAAAEAESSALLAGAEEQARTLMEEAQRDVRAEVARLESARQQLEEEMDVLATIVDEERERARTWLAQVAAALDHPARAPSEVLVRGSEEAPGPAEDARPSASSPAD